MTENILGGCRVIEDVIKTTQIEDEMRQSIKGFCSILVVTARNIRDILDEDKKPEKNSNVTEASKNNDVVKVFPRVPKTALQKILDFTDSLMPPPDKKIALLGIGKSRR